MNRDKRVEYIREIEKLRTSNLLVYFTGDRQGMMSWIAEDAVLPLYRHLLDLGPPQACGRRMDLYLYTRGGDVSVPWRVVAMLREFCDELCVLIPYKAYSAGTMLALGADVTVMGTKAELSPIDPTLMRASAAESTVPPPQISVEDVSSYISFMRERANITDQAALARVVSQLASNLTPLTLGSVNRQYSHIRLVARKLLTSGKEKVDEGKLGSIIEALTEKMYSHGHAIARKEARELGLQVEDAPKDVEHLMWNLYEENEDMLSLAEPLDPEELLAREKGDEVARERVPLAAIESTQRLHVFELNYVFRRKRQVPSNPQVNINLNLGLPAGIEPAGLPKDLQRILQQLLGQVQEAVPQIVQQELMRQCPVVGIEGRTFGGKWVDKTEEGA